MRKYDQIMDHLQVTDDMKARILSSLKQAEQAPASPASTLPFRHTKRYLSLAACLVLLIVGAAVLPHWQHNTPEPDEPGVMGVPNITEVDSVQALAEAVGFPVSDVPILPFTPTETDYTAYGQDLAQITYINQTQTAVYRKSPLEEDNSGDYNVYADVQTISITGISVTLKGNDGSYALAIWQSGSYSYSLSLSPGAAPDSWNSILSALIQAENQT